MRLPATSPDHEYFARSRPALTSINPGRAASCDAQRLGLVEGTHPCPAREKPSSSTSAPKRCSSSPPGRRSSTKADAGAGEDAETLAEGGAPLAAEFAGDPGAEELSGAIDQLSDDEVIDLIGLTWVGRGDFDRTSWAEARALAADRHRRHSSRYLMGVPLLGEYLEGGLDELGRWSSDGETDTP